MMNKDQVIQMAREAGFVNSGAANIYQSLERFAALAYAQGQRDMREVADELVLSMGFRSNGTPAYAHISHEIRALPIKEVK